MKASTNGATNSGFFKPSLMVACMTFWSPTMYHVFSIADSISQKISLGSSSLRVLFVTRSDEVWWTVSNSTPLTRSSECISRRISFSSSNLSYSYMARRRMMKCFYNWQSIRERIFSSSKFNWELFNEAFRSEAILRFAVVREGNAMCHFVFVSWLSLFFTDS